MSRPKCKDGSLDMRYSVCKESIKECLCAEKSLSAHTRPLKYGTVLMMQPMPIVYGKLLNWQCMESNHG